jgi:hypothetical protein
MPIKDTDAGELVRWKRGWRDLSDNSDAAAPKLVTGTCVFFFQESHVFVILFLLYYRDGGERGGGAGGAGGVGKIDRKLRHTHIVQGGNGRRQGSSFTARYPNYCVNMRRERGLIPACIQNKIDFFCKTQNLNLT